MAKVIGIVRSDELPSEAEKEELPDLFTAELNEIDGKYNRD